MKGGLWKNSARPPQKLTGVGFISQGFEIVGALSPHAGQLAPPRRWMIEGIEGEMIGDMGLAHGGRRRHRDRPLRSFASARRRTP